MPKWTSEQLEAIEKSGNNIIVSAGAGSGKTAVLSERVLYKIDHGIHIGELLILTFTRAAAEEMKDRIRKKLQKDEKYKKEVDAIDSAYITTFDSFALSVVKKYHYLLGLKKDICITDESIVKIEKNNILDKIFDKYYESDNLYFENFIKQFCLKNDNLLKNDVLKIANEIENFINPIEFLEDIKNNFFTEKNLNNIIEKYKNYVIEKKELIIKEKENLSYYVNSDYMTKLEVSLEPIMQFDNIEDFSKINNIKLPMLPRGSEEETKKAKERLKKSIDEILELTKYGNDKEIKNNILKSKDIVLILIDILEEYFKKLNEYKLQQEIFTFQDIASFAIKIVSENQIARNELKNSFKEIMIDEYQDTNDIQETFISYISNNNVYMVGDIKQSIYRFRGSNPDIFKTKYDNYSINRGGYKIDLIKNFRSREEVLTNINQLFDLIMDNDIGGAEYYESHEMVFGNKVYSEKREQNFNYNMEILEYENDTNKEFTDGEIEIFTIANDIKNKMASNIKVFDKESSELRKIKYSDFVIILDRSKYFDNYKKIFEYLNIPLVILKDDKLNTSDDLLIIKNIIDFIIRINNNDFSTEFKYDFLSIGRSFLYEISDQELFENITNNKIIETKIYSDFKKIKNYNSKNITEFLEEILDITDFYNKIYKIGDYENINLRLNTLYEITQNLTKSGMTIEDFKNYLDEIIDKNYEMKYTAFSGSSDSVKILTIHKSKGLEYPFCYFADLDHKFNISDLKQKFIVDKTYGIISPIISDDLQDTVLKVLYRDKYLTDEISEKIRLFYVALTRARENIIMVIPQKETEKLEKNCNGTIDKIRRKKFIKLSDFVYAIKNYLPKYFKNIDLKDLNLTKNYLYNKSLESLNLKNNYENFTVEKINLENKELEENKFSKNNYKLLTNQEIKNMDFGTTIHECFELIDFKNFDKNILEDKFISNKIEKFLVNPIMKNIKEANIYKEYEFEYNDNKTILHGIIDLMVEYDDYIDIIDYKLNDITDENYKKQINGYKKYISTITSKKINTYLYSILTEKFILID